MDEQKPWFKDVLKIAQMEKSPGVRASVRFPLQMSVEVTLGDRTLHMKSENVSANGISLVAGERVVPGKRIRFRMTMPSEIMGTPKDVEVSCRGRVVRCDPDGETFRIAATIDTYSFSES